MEDRAGEEELEREREKMKIKMERIDLVDSLRKEVVQRLKDGFEGLEEGGEGGVVFEGLSEAKRVEVVERELKKEVNRVGNEAALELGYEELEREIDFRVESRRQRLKYLEGEAIRKVEEEERNGKEKELEERREELVKMQVRFPFPLYFVHSRFLDSEGGTGGQTEASRGARRAFFRFLVSDADSPVPLFRVFPFAGPSRSPTRSPRQATGGHDEEDGGAHARSKHKGESSAARSKVDTITGDGLDYLNGLYLSRILFPLPLESSLSLSLSLFSEKKS